MVINHLLIGMILQVGTLMLIMVLDFGTALRLMLDVALVLSTFLFKHILVKL